MKKLISYPFPVQQALKDIGATIVAARKEKKVSQVELAERLGVTQATVSRIERGHPGSSIAIVLKALWVLDLPLWPSLDLETSEQMRLLQNKAKVLIKMRRGGTLSDDF